jgi:HAD superfamily hydrolase (TIGR01484 family)
MTPPLALDIDGTLTTPDHTIDPRLFPILAEWDAPVVIATGKAFPFPVALCSFVGIPVRIIAENGGVALVEDQIHYAGDPDRVDAAIAEYRARGGELGWGQVDTVNRWRETEVAVRRTEDEALLREIAAEFDLDFVDTQFAYHLKTPGVEKGVALRAVADILDAPLSAFVAVGDSENDVSTFEAVGESYAVANADEAAKAAATHVLEADYAGATLSVLEALQEE